MSHIYTYIKRIDLNCEPIPLIEHSVILSKLNKIIRKEKIKNLILNFSDFVKENLYVINESLGVNKEVSDFCNSLFGVIKNDITNNIRDRDINISNNFGLENIKIVYYYSQSNDVASIKKDNNNNILLLLYVNNISDILSTLNHEFLHIYSEMKGHNQSDYYQSLLELHNKYPTNYGYIGRLIYYLYFYTEHEMNANIQELWKEIENQNIKDVESFDIYVKKHDFYSIIKSTENIDLKNIWINIQKEYMTNILINALDIENVDLWLSKTEKKLKYKSNKLKRRIFKLRDLFDTKYKN